MQDKPLRLSWSQLRTHEECPAKSYLLSQGFKSPVSNVRNYFHGTVVDICQRRWLAQDHPEPGQMQEWVDVIFAAAEADARESGDGIVRWKHPGDKDETREFCREAVRRLEPLLQRICLPYDWDPAVRFVVPLTIPGGPDDEPRDIELAGEVDLLVEYPPGHQLAGVVPWDLKVTRDEHYWRKVKGQLVFYCIAVAAMRGMAWPPAAGLVQPMCQEQLPVFAFTEDDYAQMFGRITSLARDRWAGRVQPKAGNEGCTWCEVRGKCPKFPKGRGRTGLGAAAVQPA